MTLIVDTFDRDVASGWGSTYTGHTWQLSNGLVSERTVHSGAGRVTLASSPGTIRGQHLDRPWGDGEILAQVAAGQVSESESMIAALLFRRDPGNSGDFYRARVLFGTDSTVSVDVTRDVTLVGTRVDTGLTYTPGYRLWVRARVDGHRVRARVWPAGTTEPTTWHADETITTDPIPVGHMGVMVSAFANNTNTSPYIDWRRVEVTYRTVVDNRLNGTTGALVSNTSLVGSATTGTVTVQAPGARASYDLAHTVREFSTVRVESGHHRQETPQLRAALPAAPWSARWYVWHPSIPAGTGERRWLAAIGGVGLSSYETTSAHIGTRLQPTDLAAAEVVPTITGTAHGPDQWLRIEMVCDGTDTTVRIYPGNATADPRQLAFPGQVLTGNLDVTGFRFRRRTTLYWGDQGPAVAELQNELIDLGYDLGQWGADGDYGDATYNAVLAFQSDYGLTPVDGVAGPETRAAIDLALGRVPDPLWVSHLAVADGEWIGPAEPLPPEPVRRSRLVLGMRI